MSLQQDIQNLMEQMGKQIPAEMMEQVGALIQRLAKEQVGLHAKKTGDRAPNFSLLTAQGTTINLAEKLKKGPVVLSFYRGGWCPFCDLSLRALQKIDSQVRAKGASLFAISPQTMSHSSTTAKTRALTFDLLSDPGNKVAKTYGLVFGLRPAEQDLHTQMKASLPLFNGDESWELPVAATYIIRPDETIAWHFIDPNFTSRAEPADILSALDNCLPIHT